MSEFTCTGCGAKIRVEGLEPSLFPRKVYCEICGHVSPAE
jgi:transposase